MTTVKEAIRHLQSNGFKPDDVIAVAIWQVEDVLERAKEKKMKITKAQAEEIIDHIDRKQDATLGINWDTIDAHLDYM